MNTSPSTSTLGAITLGRVFGFKPHLAHELIDKAGSIENLFKLSECQRNSLLGPFSPFKDQLNDASLEESLRDLRRITECGARYVSIEDQGYPQRLKECYDAPIGLYYKSITDIQDLFNRPMISIVGTRDVSTYGQQWCQKIVLTLSKAPIKPTIVSGLALGVDSIAHEAALQFGLPTMAILPTGIEAVYPRRHWALARKCSQTPLCGLVSDFSIGYPVTVANFLRRNRIIAALSSATILVESKKHGGGLITARLASEYNRDIYALPGRIDDVRSQGCNNLIEQHIAESIANLETLSSRLGLGHTILSPNGSFSEKVERFYANLPPEMLEDVLSIAKHLENNRDADIENIASICGLTYSRALGLCVMLQKDNFLQMDLLQRCSIIVKNE